MIFLLDENIPVQLYRRLREAGLPAEHIIILVQHGGNRPSLSHKRNIEAYVSRSRPAPDRTNVLRRAENEYTPVHELLKLAVDLCRRVLGRRGIPDRDILLRLLRDDVVLVTQDMEFAAGGAVIRGRVILSRLPQSLAITTRVDIWHRALTQFAAATPPGQMFELSASGEIMPLPSR